MTDSKLTKKNISEDLPEDRKLSDEELIEKYRDMVRHIARKYFLLQGDNEDLEQEGLIGLYEAIRSFDEAKGSFSGHAWRCIERHIQNVVTRANTEKRRLPNSAVMLSIDEKTDSGEWDRLEPTDPSQDPEAISITNDTFERFRFALSKQLSPIEKDVLALLYEDYDYRQIARKLGKNPKTIDNAIQRVRKKARSLKEVYF